MSNSCITKKTTDVNISRIYLRSIENQAYNPMIGTVRADKRTYVGVSDGSYIKNYISGCFEI